MQTQFGSMSLVAQAFERELRADAARTRSAPTADVGRTEGRLVRGWTCRVARAGVVRVRRCFGSTGVARRLVLLVR
jgi:hypothetical protein